MRRPLGSMLLRGAQTITVMTLMGLPLLAQDKPAAASPAAPRFPLEVAVLYHSARAETIGGNSFWQQGAGLQIEGRLTRSFGVVGDVAGLHIANINNSGVGLDLVTATFGPRLTWTPAHSRFAVFGQALAGEGIGFNSVFPGATGATTSSYNLAVKMGGGMNLALAPHVALRAFEADWLRTELPNTGGNVQNDLSLAAGIVFRFR